MRENLHNELKEIEGETLFQIRQHKKFHILCFTFIFFGTWEIKKKRCKNKVTSNEQKITSYRIKKKNAR